MEDNMESFRLNQSDHHNKSQQRSNFTSEEHVSRSLHEQISNNNS